MARAVHLQAISAKGGSPESVGPGEKRAAYGEQILRTLSEQLTTDYSRGFSRFALSRMMRLSRLCTFIRR
jgi:hypothetical protein